MPKRPTPEPLSCFGRFAWIALLSGFIGGTAALIWNIPAFALLVLGFLALQWWHNINWDRKFLRMAHERKGLSICDFARAFDRRTVDPYVIRAVYEELQDYLMHGKKSLPILPDDDLFVDCQMDHDDLDLDIVEIIAFRTGRSLDGFDKNPFIGKVSTARDLVMFFNMQPRQVA